ncbi:MAG TPA: S8 family serine peptidase [Candidatus Angelobacter sp.]|nr:S8 family serine peptidase [Candidatus Angelobacter sp.]
MADNDLRPIQVFLDTKRFIEIPEPQQFVPGTKDFFKGNDRGFLQHKTKLRTSVQGVANSLRHSKQPGGFVKVRQREEALAKSHRPMGALFTASNHFALVGAERVGELLFQVTPSALDRLANIIDTKAEETPRLVMNRKTGKEEPRATPVRSELGGIEDIRLYDAPDKVAFSAEEAVRWMRQENVIGGYIVEMFRPDRGISPNEVDQMIAQFRDGLSHLKGGLLVRAFLPSVSTTQFGEPSLAISVQLTADDRRLIELPFSDDGRSAVIAEASLPASMRGSRADLNVARHGELLAFLAEQSLVRSVELPPTLETTPASGGANLGKFSIPDPAEGVDYPTIAIIDGGVSPGTLGKWKVAEAGLVPATDRDETHGTFIAGLVSAGSALNPTLSASIEPHGCKFYDLDLFPRRDLRHTYYADIEELFDILDEKVKVAKRDHGVRVFNLSFSIGTRSSRLAYSLAADRLDRIARANDVLFVVAAGNLTNSSRPPWPEKAEDAAIMLAGFSSDNQQLTAPAEHVLGITVGAINPLGVVGHIPQMPTTYTRRGPGVGGARKPDLAHYGGVDSTSHTGLISLSPMGDAFHNCGTSFAAPLAAATIATLDHRLARQAARETLLALPVHRATRPGTLNRPALRHVSREFVGFGVAPPADSILHDAPHSVTLVFSDRLTVKQRLEFPFTWPKSLVNEDGSCRGRADVTLSYTPPIDPDHREEAIRVQLEAHLHQERLDVETGELQWEGRLSHDAGDVPEGMNKSESYLVRTGLKWSPVKRYHLAMREGRGNTSNWKLSLESLVRAGVAFPSEGVTFSLILTISDIASTAPVREEMRLGLQNRGLVLADITVAHRLRPRSN